MDGLIVSDAPSKVWEPDCASSFCHRCDKPWTIFTRRRHHCRSCGCLVCDACSPHRVKFDKHDVAVRTCTPCYTILTALLSEKQHLLAFYDRSQQENGKVWEEEEIITTSVLPDQVLICGGVEIDENYTESSFAGEEIEHEADGEADDESLFALDAPHHTRKQRHSLGPIVLEEIGSPEHQLAHQLRTGVPPLLTMKELNDSPSQVPSPGSASTPIFLRTMSFGESQKF